MYKLCHNHNRHFNAPNEARYNLRVWPFVLFRVFPNIADLLPNFSSYDEKNGIALESRAPQSVTLCYLGAQQCFGVVYHELTTLSNSWDNSLVDARIVTMISKYIQLPPPPDTTCNTHSISFHTISLEMIFQHVFQYIRYLHRRSLSKLTQTRQNVNYIPQPTKTAIHDSKYGTNRVLFASTYTTKRLQTMYYSLN